MAPSSKSAAAAKDRRKSNNNSAGLVTLRVPSAKLRAIVDPDYVKEDSPVKESPATSTTLPAATVNSTTENASDSSPNTPAAGTPAPPSVSMGPPAEGPKKKGVKRGAAALNGEPKVRGKPGPKKKQRLYVTLPSFIPSSLTAPLPDALLTHYTVRMEPSKAVEPVSELTSSVPRPTKVLSMLAFAPSTDLASPVASGAEAASP